jgi:hypothetical protein
MKHPIENETLFLVHLSEHDFAKFDKNPFSYSGSTGAGAVTHPEWYPTTGAYIATYMSELLTALHVFGWKTVQLHRRGNAWFAEHQGMLSA